MSNEPQPGSPGAVDLDAFEPRVLTGQIALTYDDAPGDEGPSEELVSLVAELRTLRARVAATRVAARDFRDALSARQHGDVAAWKCAKRVELLFEPLGPDSCPDCSGSGEEFRADLDVFAQCRACGGNGWKGGVRR